MSNSGTGYLLGSFRFSSASGSDYQDNNDWGNLVVRGYFRGMELYEGIRRITNLSALVPIMGLTGASTFFYIHVHTWPSGLPAKQDCWFTDLRFLIGVSFFLHPNVGVRATLSVLLDDRLDRTVRVHRPGSCVTVGSTRNKRC